MSEIITIEKVEESKSTRGVFKTVTYGGGKKASCFEGGLLSLLTVGATLEVEIVTNQKGDKTYHNITAAKPSSQPVESPAGKPAPGRGREPGERQSIERQTALKAAVELAGYSMAKGAEVKMGDVLRGASMMARFLAEGWVPAESPAVASGAPPEGMKAATSPETPAKGQLSLNGVPHDWQWFCAEVLKIKGMTVMKAMAILEIEKSDQWKGTWDEALAKVKVKA